MKDTVLKGTGNSRFLKSVEDFKTRYPTYDDFAAALVAGTLPIDLNGINTAGIEQLGTAMNKENLLTDATAALLGLDEEATPNEAFAAAARKDHDMLFATCDSEWNAAAKVATTINGNFELRDGASIRVKFKNPPGSASGKTLNVDGTGAVSLPVSNDAWFYGEVVDFTYVASNRRWEHANRRYATASYNYGYYGWTRLMKYPNYDNDDWAASAGALNQVYDIASAAAKFQSGQYVGTGTYGEDNPCSITFDFIPKVVFLGCNDSADFGIFPYTWYTDHFLLESFFGNINENKVTIKDAYTMSWYSASGNAQVQLNTKGKTYYWAAIG